MIKSPECDKLLISLAKYLECYFNILKFEEKFADEKLLPTINQLKEQEELHIRIDSLKYDFSLDYAKFLLLERSLMFNTCPRPIDPIATSKTDRNLFTRSEMFNSLGRQGASYFGQKDECKNINKIYHTHLPRASMLNKCSPALRLLLPDAAENVSRIHPNKTENNQRKIHMNEINADGENEKIGILGDYRHLYDDQLILNKETADSDQTKPEDDNEDNDEANQKEDDKKSE
ncbi:unnamed protein product [Schistosoma turkestanicum]|nr:unnamed protein product [Schistosoma turkestanicum]